MHVCLRVCLHVSICNCSSVCLSVCMSVCLSVSLSACLSVSLSVCMCQSAVMSAYVCLSMKEQTSISVPSPCLCNCIYRSFHRHEFIILSQSKSDHVTSTVSALGTFTYIYSTCKASNECQSACLFRKFWKCWA